MNRKLSRLIQPGMALYFAVMLLFAVATVFWQWELWLLAAIEGGIIVLLYGYYKISTASRRRAISSYIQTATDTLETAAKGDMPFPTILVKLNDGEIVWSNDRFNKITGMKESMLAQRVGDVLPDFTTDWLASGKAEAPKDVTVNKRRYRVLGNVVKESDSGLLLGTLYFVDMTELLHVKDEYIRSRPIVCIILVDNYDELTNNLSDASVSTMNAAINNCIKDWADGIGGLLRKLERNRYLFLMEAKDLHRAIDEKFSLLDTVRSVTSPRGVAATVSMGVGKDGVSFEEDYDFASLSIEMALSRGGDQAVIKDRYNFSFYGGRARETDRRTKVKSRVLAASLGELIAQSSQVYVMGHKNADLDALGAAVGVCCLCRKKGKQAKIVMDLEQNAAKNLLERLLKQPEYADSFIGGQKALIEADPKSLLIIVDTNRPNQVEYLPLLESIPRVCVIDHHRRAADYIERTVLSLHEPFASSASELVTELLQYAVETTDIRAFEAQALLAGIALDTKNFSVRTSGRTFEAAAFLRRLGADTVEVKKLFKNDLQSTLTRYQVIQSARLYRSDIAISALDFSTTRIIAAQAADELLNISGIETSFVLYPQDDRVIISARSIGDANVQMILEPLGGGGNAATAGAQVPGKSVQEVLNQLIAAIDDYYKI